jgi:hypothetical protein
MSLQTALLNVARSDRRNVRLGIAKRGRRCMDRVVPKNEIVLMRSGRTENELGIGRRLELDRLARRLESREVPVPQSVRRGQDARCDGRPEDDMAPSGARNASARQPSGVPRGNSLCHSAYRLARAPVSLLPGRPREFDDENYHVEHVEPVCYVSSLAGWGGCSPLLAADRDRLDNHAFTRPR